MSEILQAVIQIDEDGFFDRFSTNCWGVICCAFIFLLESNDECFLVPIF